MAIKRSYIIAGLVIVLIAAWFAVNSLGGGDTDYVEPEPFAETDIRPAVVVRRVESQTHPVRIGVYGRTRPNRSVDVKAKTAASLVSVPPAEGRQVQRGAVLCRQDVDARQALVDQAKAAVAKAETDLTATQRLVDRGFKSPNAIAGDRAALDAARAQLRQAENELGNIVMRAPFTGMLEQKLAEVGDYLAPGQPCARVVELDPLRVEAEVGETQVGGLSVGQEVSVSLATGQSVGGMLDMVESVANPATRTFRVEALIPNSDLALKAGVSAELGLGLGEVEATRVPAAVLALDGSGRTGVRYVDTSDRVRFAAVDVVEETAGGVWVTGLPSPADIIVEGQDFVDEGAEVDARREGERARALVAGSPTSQPSSQ